jgi:hypothetical protein
MINNSSLLKCRCLLNNLLLLLLNMDSPLLSNMEATLPSNSSSNNLLLKWVMADILLLSNISSKDHLKDMMISEEEIGLGQEIETKEIEEVAVEEMTLEEIEEVVEEMTLEVEEVEIEEVIEEVETEEVIEEAKKEGHKEDLMVIGTVRLVIIGILNQENNVTDAKRKRIKSAEKFTENRIEKEEVHTMIEVEAVTEAEEEALEVEIEEEAVEAVMIEEMIEEVIEVVIEIVDLKELIVTLKKVIGHAVNVKI